MYYFIYLGRDHEVEECLWYLKRTCLYWWQISEEKDTRMEVSSSNYEGSMDGLTDGQMDGCMDGWMDG